MAIELFTKGSYRLTVLFRQTSPLLTHIDRSVCTSVTILSVHSPNLVNHLSRLYLTPIECTPSFWQILQRASERRTGDQLALAGQAGMEVRMDWGDAKGVIVQIFVKKPTGTIKGIDRYLGALSISSTGLKSVPLSTLVKVHPISSTDRPNDRNESTGFPSDLNIPFNLNLTDDQKRRRGEVPLPYTHEGEGARSGLASGMAWIDQDDDEDDDEI